VQHRLSSIDVLRALSDLQAKNGLVPTVRELGTHLGVTGPSIQRHLKALVASGYVTHRPFQSRTLTVTPEGMQALTG
jgi:DNA-binding MarR family transcriptional regulator